MKSGFFARRLVVDLVRGLVGGLEDFLRERAQLRAGADEAAKRRRVPGVVLRLHLDIGEGGGRGQDRLIGLRQFLPLRVVDEEVDGRAAFPEAGIVVERRDLGEAELLVVIGADPLGGVDRAALERRVDVAARDLLRHDAELRHDEAGKARDAHLEALHVGTGS